MPAFCNLKRGVVKMPKNLRCPPEHGQTEEDRGSILPRLSQKVRMYRAAELVEHTFHLQIELRVVQLLTHAPRQSLYASPRGLYASVVGVLQNDKREPRSNPNFLP